MTSPIGARVCEACARLDRDFERRKEPAEASRCGAFQEGIPFEISHGGFDHRQPYQGDGGVRFKLMGGEEAADDLAFYERYWASRRGESTL